MEHQYKPYKFLAVFICFLFISFLTQAQTPGLIYKPATSGGNKVLDPNGDGYVSMTKSGFSGTNDEGAGLSEIPYRPFPALTTEPISDLNTGSGGGHTDLATPTATSAFTGSPIAAYFDGTNLLFRIRLGSSSTASKGYSVLIDSDQKFDGTGTNPGFEYEVLLASNFAVQVIKHTPTGINTIFTGSIDQYSQRSVAASTSGGNADYFYDFYVPLTAFKGEITTSTPLRMSGITITSAQSGITGTVSDVGGVNFQAYNYDAPSAWRALIGAFPATSLSTLQTSAFPQIAAAAPVVSGLILSNSTSISGTSTEAAGSVITVYRSVSGGTSTSIGTTTVSANGTWSLTGISSTLLTAGNTITATVTAPSKSVSLASAPVTVTAGVCTATPPPVITTMGSNGNTNRSFIGTTSYSGNQKITIYSAVTNQPIPGTTAAPNPFTFNSTTPGSTWTSPIYVVGDLNYYATVTPIDASGNTTGCESLRSNQICFKNGNPTVNNQQVTVTSVIYQGNTYNSSTSSTWSEIPTNFTSISGSITLNGTSNNGFVTIFKNGAVTTERVSFTTTSLNWTITPSATFLASLKPGDILNVRTEFNTTSGNTAICSNVYSSRSNTLTVQETTTAPTIATPKCGKVITLMGTSSEPAGTVIQFYTGGTAGSRDGTLITESGTTTAITATVASTGAWAANFSKVTGGGVAAGTAITARAKAPGKVRSVNSISVQSTAAPTSTSFAITGPISEGQTTISGTAPANASVMLYIEGTPFTPVTATSTGAWSVKGLSAFEVFAGASVTATYKTAADQCESDKLTPLIVQCAAPSTASAVSPFNQAVCTGGVATVTVSNSVPDIAYRLVTVSGTAPNETYTETGSSVIGTGGTITLTSASITSATTLRVRARKIGGTNCDALLSGSIAITVNAIPPSNYQVSINSTSGCANTTPTITVAGTQAGYTYQLINNITKQPVLLLSGNSNALAGNGGNLAFQVAAARATTTYGIRVTTTATGCTVDNANLITYTVSGPASNQPVTISATRTCTGGSAIVYVQTNNDNYSYQLYREATTAVAVDAAFTGTGQTQKITVSPAATATYFVRVTGANCIVDLSNRVTLEVSEAGPIASASVVEVVNNQPVCATRVTLQGNNPAPGTGKWTINTSPNNNTDGTITDPTNPNTTVTGLTSGTYVFTWTVNTTNCGSAAANTTVVINCPTQYIIAAPKYIEQYRTNDILATASDPDKLPTAPTEASGVTSATLVSGTALPPGTELLASGNIRVSDRSALISGTYRFSVTTVDQRGVATTTPITLNIYGTEPTITPLPVELVYFTATVQSGVVHLQWLTASEKDNKEFVVERSADGKAFESIGSVAGNGNSSLPINYSFADEKPLSGTAYYRLKQVDHSGEFAYSKVIAVSAQGIAADMQLQAYPNPFDAELNITVTAQKNGTAALQLFDMQGKLVHTGQVELQPGVNELVLPLKFVRRGMYILRLTGNGINGSVKVLKY